MASANKEWVLWPLSSPLKKASERFARNRLALGTSCGPGNFFLDSIFSAKNPLCQSSNVTKQKQISIHSEKPKANSPGEKQSPEIVFFCHSTWVVCWIMLNLWNKKLWKCFCANIPQAASTPLSKPKPFFIRLRLPQQMQFVRTEATTAHPQDAFKPASHGLACSTGWSHPSAQWLCSSTQKFSSPAPQTCFHPGRSWKVSLQTIAGCHCLCWVPLVGAMLGCHCRGAMQWVPLLGAIVGAMAGCHCSVPLPDASYQL